MPYSQLTEKEVEAVKAFTLELYDVRQVAMLFGITERTIMNYVKAGRLRGNKIGGKWRFTKGELERFAKGE